METTVLMRLVVSISKFDSLEDLISIVKAAGRQLVAAQPKGLFDARFLISIYKYTSNGSHRTYRWKCGAPDIAIDSRGMECGCG
jgi:hypothetical protein